MINVPVWTLALGNVFSPVTRDRSVGGSYVGREPMGLFWSLQPAPGGREGLRQVMRSASLTGLTNKQLNESKDELRNVKSNNSPDLLRFVPALLSG